MHCIVGRRMGGGGAEDGNDRPDLPPTLGRLLENPVYHRVTDGRHENTVSKYLHSLCVDGGLSGKRGEREAKSVGPP